VTRVPCFLCAALLLLAARISPGAELEARPPRQVDLIIGAAAGDTALLEPAMRDMLVKKGLAVDTTRKAVVTAQDVAAAIAPPREATPSVARVLLDFTTAGQGTLFLIDPRRGRVYVRRMALAHGLDAVARASVRFVVEQSVDAILEGREIGVSREEFQRTALPPAPVAAPPPAPAVPLAPPRPAPPPTELALAAGYELVAMGSGEIQHAAKLAVSARRARLDFAAAARLAAPISIAGDGAQARLWTTGVALSGAVAFAHTGDLSVLAGLAAGIDFTHVAPSVTSPGLQQATAFWAAGPWLRPFAGAEWTAGRLSVALAAGAEVHLLAERYTVKTATDTRDVFAPARVRPTAALLIGLRF
jgi:hypothetical protein